MLSTLRARLAPPTFEGDPDKTRIGRLLHSTLLATFVLGVVFVPLGAANPENRPGVLAIMGGMTALVPTSLLWLVRRGHVKLSCVLFVSLFFIAVVGCVAVVGSVRAPIVSLFLVCIVIAGLILSHRGAVVVAVLSLLAYVGLWSAERAGMLPPLRDTQFASLVTFVAAVTATAVFVTMVTRSVEGALGRLRRSERRLSESLETLRETQSQLLHTQKMEAVGRLAGGVAHDFNNLLTAILGYSDLLLGDTTPNPAMASHLRGIQTAAERAAALTSQLLAFSHKQILHPRVLDLNAVVVDMKEMLGRMLGEDIVLEFELAPRLGHVMADPGQVQQIILNLAANARDAMPHGGTLTITTSDLVATEAGGWEAIGVRSGAGVVLAVTDTGVGMDVETQSRMFEPFFTTKDVGEGTGLGLSSVYGIVEQSSGCIRVDSEPGQGTTFRIWLPRTDAPLEARPASAPAAEALQGTETILLVEDEDVLRTLMRQFLVQNGYTVLAAGDADEAIQLHDQQAGRIHLLLTDVVLPGKMNGMDLAERLGQLRPEMRVLCMSGYTDRAGTLDDAPAHGPAFMSKPFKAQSLLSKVREVLGEPTPASPRAT